MELNKLKENVFLGWEKEKELPFTPLCTGVGFSHGL
jgi:hypothetical protein